MIVNIAAQRQKNRTPAGSAVAAAPASRASRYAWRMKGVGLVCDSSSASHAAASTLVALSCSSSVSGGRSAAARSLSLSLLLLLLLLAEWMVDCDGLARDERLKVDG